MDWVTADESESLARIAGTEGESKRIESLQILILNDAQAAEFDLRQEAIKELKAYANSTEFTMNSKLLAKTLDEQIGKIEGASGKSDINAKLNAAKKAVDDLMNDREVKNAITTLCKSLDAYFTTKQDNLDVALTDGELKGVKLLEVSSVKQAIEDAKAELYNKETYESTDFTDVSGKYFVEVYNAAKKAILDYAVESLETLYYAEADAAHGNKVLSKGNYLDAKKDANTLAKLDKDGNISESNLSAMAMKDLKDFFTTKLKRDSNITLLRTNYAKKLDMTGKDTKCDKDVKKYAETLIQNYQKLNDANLLEDNITKYIDVSWIKSAVQDGLEDIKTAMSAPELESIIESTKSNALEGLVRFVTKLRNDLSGLNGTEKVLSEEAIAAINKVLASEELTGETLVDACNAMIASLKLSA